MKKPKIDKFQTKPYFKVDRANKAWGDVTHLRDCGNFVVTVNSAIILAAAEAIKKTF